MDNELFHYGTPRHSGRYPWGSGENPYQHEEYFRKSVQELRAKGLTDKQIMTGMGMKSTEFRMMNSISKAAQRSIDTARALQLKDKGYSNVQIGKMLDPPRPESSVRALLDPALKERNDSITETANFLKSQLKTKQYLDIGDGVEREIGDGISTEKLNTAAKMLKLEGYEIYNIRVEQVTNKGKYTTIKVLAPAGTTYSEVYNNLDKLQSVADYKTFDEASSLGILPPKSMSSDRIMINYKEDGGEDKDGVIELRRGVEDISLGNSSYAQVRIAVDGTHYMKGMAMYSDGMPDGVDIIFNTNKRNNGNKLDALKVMKPDMNDPKVKEIKDMVSKKNLSKDAEAAEVDKLISQGVKNGTIKPDLDNPFGATIKVNGQRKYIDANGKEHLSVINKVNEEGDWGEYTKTLSSQFLSKQNRPLVKKQLDLSYSEKVDEYERICALTNPTVKKKLLESFSDDCDASAVHLKAAALPRQAFQVILPITSLKETEVYAPNYKNGEHVCLIRYPHGGTFEIPELVVNNRHGEAKSILGKAKDAIGINSKVAERLSGADFDGDTVLVIPVNDKVRIKTSKALDDLKDFNPKEAYPGYEGMKVMTAGYKQNQMGIVSNLITDMTLRGATPSELARAVKHSMVVIDSEKHKLDWQRSERENGIAELKAKYQEHDEGERGGAATLISRAKSEERVNERKIFSIDRDTDKETGERVFRETGRKKKVLTGVNAETGKKIYTETDELATEKSTRMFEAKDARTLISKANTPIENLYADYANKLKALANTARKEYISTKGIKRDVSAAKTYAHEVNSLSAKLNNALKNAPKERMAQVVATTVVKAKKDSNGDITKAEEKKLRQQALSASRNRLGARKKDVLVEITDREWEAIQAGAISNTMLKDILNNTDLDAIKERATPRASRELSSNKIARIKNMLNSGYSTAEIAEATGVSTSTVVKYMK